MATMLHEDNYSPGSVQIHKHHATAVQQTASHHSYVTYLCLTVPAAAAASKSGSSIEPTPASLLPEPVLDKNKRAVKGKAPAGDSTGNNSWGRHRDHTRV
jgi:hypothetical protein